MKDILSQEVLAKFPDYVRGVVIARGVDNSGEKTKLIEMLQEVVQKATQDESLQDIKNHPRVAAVVWNQEMDGYKMLGEAKYYQSGKYLELVKQIPENKDMPCKGALVITIDKVFNTA